MRKILIKLGGSVITDKKQSPPKAKKEEIQRLAREISLSRQEDMQLLIVHGAGCFGHIPAHQYRLTADNWHDEKRIGSVIIRQYMNELNTIVVSNLVEAGLAAIAFQPSAAAVLDQKKLQLFPVQILSMWMSYEIVPVLYGDVALDKQTGIDILSGDQIISYLTRFLKPDLVILGTDVDGVFSADPKQNPQAALISEINRENIDQVIQGLQGSQYVDVTGGMAQKVMELMSLAQDGCKIQIINATINGRLKQALSGNPCPGTWICTKS